MAERKLGRGLDVLIGKPTQTTKGVEVLEVDPASVDPNPEQPRKQFPASEMEHLKGSIAREGVLQPIVVRRAGDRFQLVAGERRLRAAQELGLERLPALVVAAGDDRLLELAVIENLQRADLNPIEVARAFRKLVKMKSWTQDSLAQAIGLSRSSAANFLRLLDLPGDMQDALARGQITLGHAKVLLSVTGAGEQRLLFEKIAEEKLSVRDLESEREAVKEEAGAEGKDGKGRQAKKKKKPSNIASLEAELSERLGTKVTIIEGRGKGRIVVEFYDAEDFDRLRRLLLASTRGS